VKTVEQIDEPVRGCTFHEAKAHTLREIARRVGDEFGGTLPCDEPTSVQIGVDVHVHRVVNHLGLVAERTPEKTMGALQDRDQRHPRPVRQARLHRHSPEVFDVPPTRRLPPGRRDNAPLKRNPRSGVISRACPAGGLFHTGESRQAWRAEDTGEMGTFWKTGSSGRGRKTDE
jgi:hypothetical protein